MMKTSEVFLEAFRNLEVKSLPLCENKNILNTKDTKVTKGKPFIFYSDYFVYFVSFVVKSFRLVRVRLKSSIQTLEVWLT